MTSSESCPQSTKLPSSGPRRLVFELAKRRVVSVPSELAAYRALVQAGMIDPGLRSALAQVQALGTRPRWGCGSADCKSIPSVLPYGRRYGDYP